MGGGGTCGSGWLVVGIEQRYRECTGVGESGIEERISMTRIEYSS